ncbi:unnamed protein product [Ambrosiozyma monospora]|uniref:Unnamed protein product n=1 Tax=Ambrosiozyma monospora TaxID=43982 RepID=A0ACB5T691_AMBMO|nr:unnamed protein product [Ambrosiozyma monospora]
MQIPSKAYSVYKQRAKSEVDGQSDLSSTHSSQQSSSSQYLHVAPKNSIHRNISHSSSASAEDLTRAQDRMLGYANVKNILDGKARYAEFDSFSRLNFATNSIRSGSLSSSKTSMSNGGSMRRTE